MNYDITTELQAKQTLNIISYCDHLRHWEDFNNLPKISRLTSKQKNFTEFSKERSLRPRKVFSSLENGKNLKPILIPKKPIFQQKTNVIKNEMRTKINAQNRKRIVVKTNANSSILSENKQIQGCKQSLNLMRYWFQHRLEANSMNQLIYRIQQKRKVMRSMLY